MKIAFLQENDIQGLLGKMDKLSQTERGLVSAQTFERACASATSAAEGAAYGKHILDKMAYNDAEQKERVEKEGHERTLMDVLAFDVDAESSLRRYHDIRKYVVSGTGDWLLDHAVFQRWQVTSLHLQFWEWKVPISQAKGI